MTTSVSSFFRVAPSQWVQAVVAFQFFVEVGFLSLQVSGLLEERRVAWPTRLAASRCVAMLCRRAYTR